MTATSRTPHARPSPMARFVRAGLRFPASILARSARPTGAAGHRLRAVLAGLGLAALVGLTAWAVSFVSVWLVPAYLALMVVILAGPRGDRASTAWEPGADFAGVDDAKLGRKPGTDCSAGGDHLRSDAESDPFLPAGEVVAAATPDSGLAGSGPAKPRRSRVRARKAARTAVEPVTDSRPVTWIRVGPGKFVRADRGLPVSDQPPVQEVADDGPTPGLPADAVSTIEESIAEAHPATDEPARATPTSEAAVVAGANPVMDAPEAAIPAEPDPFDASEATPHVAGPVLAFATGAGVSDSVSEEYGIAPSAFGAAAADPPLADHLDHGDPGEPVRPELDPAAASGLDGHPSRHDAATGRLESQRRARPLRPTLLPRGIANATSRPGSVAASPRRRDRSGFSRRTAVGSRSVPDRRLVPSARCAVRHITHAPRGWRPRAPPRHRAGTSPIRCAWARSNDPSRLTDAGISPITAPGNLCSKSDILPDPHTAKTRRAPMARSNEAAGSRGA